MTDEAAPPPEQEHFKWYKAYRFGEVISEGPTPMPDGIQDQATEIRWSMGVEEPTPVVPYDDGAHDVPPTDPPSGV